MIALVLFSEKGGVGKSTISFNLSHFFSERKKRTLAIDMDPQSHLSLTFSLNEPKTHRIFEDITIDPITINEYLFVVSTIRKLIEFEKGPKEKHITKLRDALKKVNNDYDFAIIDTPPGLNLFTLNSLFAANEIIIPVNPGLYSFKGLIDVLDDIKWVKEDYNPNVEIAGIVVNFSERTIATREISEALEKKYKNMVIAQIPKTVRIEEAIRRGIPVWRHALQNPATDALKELGEKLLNRKRIHH